VPSGAEERSMNSEHINLQSTGMFVVNALVVVSLYDQHARSTH